MRNFAWPAHALAVFGCRCRLAARAATVILLIAGVV